MTTYRISFRVLAVASGQFMAEVCASRHGAGLQQGHSHSESRLYSSQEIATAECRVMVKAMKDRLTSAGHEVVDAGPP